MTKLNYAQQIKHPNWQKKRLEVLEEHKFACENCGSEDEELHVHHPYYKRGAMIWQYDTDELQCLCHKCHKEAHAQDEEIKFLISDRNICKEELIGVLKAMNDSPFTQLNSYEEIIGYLSYHGIQGPIQIPLIDAIIEKDGKPYDFIAHSPFSTSYSDMSHACFKSPPDVHTLLLLGVEETKKRLAEIKKRFGRKL